MTPQERAQKAAEAMLAKDAATRWFGMEIEEMDAGFARLGLVVRKEHLNGHGTCHGGVSFALADSAFAFACNSYNRVTVGQHANISYLAPARLGDRLMAVAREVSLKGRSGIYDVRVTNQHGAILVEFRGVSRTIRGAVFDETVGASSSPDSARVPVDFDRAPTAAPAASGPADTGPAVSGPAPSAKGQKL